MGKASHIQTHNALVERHDADRSGMKSGLPSVASSVPLPGLHGTPTISRRTTNAFALFERPLAQSSLLLASDL
jgi:hypothetical protein